MREKPPYQHWSDINYHMKSCLKTCRILNNVTLILWFILSYLTCFKANSAGVCLLLLHATELALPRSSSTLFYSVQFAGGFLFLCFFSLVFQAFSFRSSFFRHSHKIIFFCAIHSHNFFFSCPSSSFFVYFFQLRCLFAKTQGFDRKRNQ